MTFRDAPDTVQDVTYAWDAAGRLKSLTRGSASPATFTYDGDGNRSSKTSSSGQVTSYVNDARGLSQVLQATVTGGHRTTYVPGVGQYDDAQPNETMRWGYTVSDAQNGRLMVDGGANISRRWEWEPFGRARAEEGVVQARFGYGGEERDDESGLINLRARYYDPAIGRFLSRDSLPGAMTNPQSWNRYSYVENDPINHVDPSGHKKSKKIKWPMGMDPDDDRNTAARKAKACRNPGQYTGSCKGGPPNAAYAADGEAQHEAKKAGQAAAAGNLAAAAAHLSAAQHFASIAGTAAANTAALQAYASIVAAVQSILAAHRVDHQWSSGGTDPLGAAPSASAGGMTLFRCSLGSEPCDAALEDGSSGLLGNPVASLDDGSECTDEQDGFTGIEAACTNMSFIGEAPVRISTGNGVMWAPVPLMSASPGAGGGGGSGPQGGTYVLRDWITQEVVYVGRTKNLANRILQHAKDKVKGAYEFVVDRATDIHEQQRGREQIVYDRYNSRLNRIRPISPTNPRRAEYLLRGHELDVP